MKREKNSNPYANYPNMIPLGEQTGIRKGRKKEKQALTPRPFYVRKLSPPKTL